MVYPSLYVFVLIFYPSQNFPCSSIPFLQLYKKVVNSVVSDSSRGRSAWKPALGERWMRIPTARVVLTSSSHTSFKSASDSSEKAYVARWCSNDDEGYVSAEEKIATKRKVRAFVFLLFERLHLKIWNVDFIGNSFLVSP
jgi:hypothetical protein